MENGDAGQDRRDLLSQFDQNFDGSIGGLGTAQERMFQSSRDVPLFEIRGIDGRTASGFEKFMKDVDSAVQALHKQFAKPPTRKVRRQGGASSCILPSSTSTGYWNTTSGVAGPTGTSSRAPTSMITSPPRLECSVVQPSPETGVDDGYCDCVLGSNSMTLSIISGAMAYSESCAYTSVPSATATISTDTSTWTSNCQACTMVGGDGGSKETCTSVSACTPTTSTTAAPSPTIKAWVANQGTIDIGNAEDGGDGGKGLAAKLYSMLSGLCDDTGKCNTDPQDIPNVEAVLAGGEEPLTPAMSIDSAYYNNDVNVYQQMLSVGISSWIAALENGNGTLCQDVEYEADADSTGSGCGSGPIPTDRLRRKIRRNDGTVLWERDGLAEERHAHQERCLDNCGTESEMHCHYSARMCNAPDSVVVVSGTATHPDANQLTIKVILDEKKGDGFDCEAIAAGLTVLMEVLAPELLEADVLEGIELEALCGELEGITSDHIVSGLDNSSKRKARRQSSGIAGYLKQW